jgi:hypothetical protein
MQLKSTELQKIVDEKPETMELSFPFENGEMTVELVKNNILTTDFQLRRIKELRHIRRASIIKG